MIKSIFRFFLGPVLLVLLQVLVLNHVNLFNRFTPQFYLLIILLLPFETPRWTLLFYGFFLGLTIDVFTDSLGLHTIATVFAAYVRYFILQVLSPRDGFEPGTLPRALTFGFPWFIKYAFSLTLLHHTILYIFEIFDITEFGTIVFYTIAATLFTTLTLVISQLFIFRR
jgi:rod shape-determining protein MreD